MTRISLPGRLVTMTGALVLAAGCGDDTAATEPSIATSSQQSTTIAAPPSVVTATDSVESVQARLDEWAAQGRGGVAVAFAADDGAQVTVAAAGSAGPDGGILEPDAAFRVGSLSKTFVAVMLLQLVADGAIELEELVTDHATELTIADGVTIRQLLAHRFTSYMQYDPSTGHVFVLLLNDDSRSPEQLGNDLLEIVRTA